MRTINQVVNLALKAHQEIWAAGNNVAEQTRRAQKTCKLWQKLVADKYPKRFLAEHGLKKKGLGQKIDLVDTKDGVAYELKASPNNVHMEIYRDVFKALVFNQVNRLNKKKEVEYEEPVATLVFIAPASGIARLGKEFVEVVQDIAQAQDLVLMIKELNGR